MGSVPSHTQTPTLTLTDSKDQRSSDALVSTVPCNSSPLAMDMFSHARRFSVSGGTFNIVLGSTESTRRSTGLPIAAQLSERYRSSPTSLPVEASGRIFHSVTPTSYPETDSERYARLLLPKRHGYPLWAPAPYTGPPPAHVEDGVRIGDVGVLSKDGGFDFIFNVCHSADDPLNRNGVPNGFTPFSLDPREADVYEQLGYFSSNSHEASSEIECTERTTVHSSTSVQSKMIFTTTKAEGALLVLPAGANRVDARRIRDLRQYAMRNAVSWYEYINDQRGWEVRNNELYLPTGCDKCTHWAVASFSKQTAERSVSVLELVVESENGRQGESVGRNGRNPFQSSLRDVPQNGSGASSNMWSSWRGSSTAACRTGPQARVQDQAGDDSTARRSNQCVFLRGFKIAIDVGTGNSLSEDAVVLSSTTDSSPDAMLSKSTDIPFGLGQGGLSSSSSMSSDLGSGSGSMTGSSDADGNKSTGELNDASEATLSMEFFPNKKQPYHPSDVINRFLLSQGFRDKNVKVAITHDDEWCSALDPLSGAMPSDEELLERMLTMYSITMHVDGAFLEQKVKSSTNTSYLDGTLTTSGIVPTMERHLKQKSPYSEDDLEDQDTNSLSLIGGLTPPPVTDVLQSSRIPLLASLSSLALPPSSMRDDTSDHPGQIKQDASLPDGATASLWSSDILVDAVGNVNVETVAHSVVKGRKSWKTRQGEAIWPPELEVALLEGLSRYQPGTSRETRMLGRFPMRNRFISEYIYQNTGQYRTAKQVGSRLCQLKATYGSRLLCLNDPGGSGGDRKRSCDSCRLLHFKCVQPSQKTKCLRCKAANTTCSLADDGALDASPLSLAASNSAAPFIKESTDYLEPIIPSPPRLEATDSDDDLMSIDGAPPGPTDIEFASYIGGEINFSSLSGFLEERTEKQMAGFHTSEGRQWTTSLPRASTSGDDRFSPLGTDREAERGEVVMFPTLIPMHQPSYRPFSRMSPRPVGHEEAETVTLMEMLALNESHPQQHAVESVNSTLASQPPATQDKSPTACSFCRGRKIQCDGASPVCNQCSRRNQQCIYDYIIKRSNLRRSKELTHRDLALNLRASTSSRTQKRSMWISLEQNSNDGDSVDEGTFLHSSPLASAPPYPTPPPSRETGNVSSSMKSCNNCRLRNVKCFRLISDARCRDCEFAGVPCQVETSSDNEPTEQDALCLDDLPLTHACPALRSDIKSEEELSVPILPPEKHQEEKAKVYSSHEIPWSTSPTWGMQKEEDEACYLELRNAKDLEQSRSALVKRGRRTGPIRLLFHQDRSQPESAGVVEKRK